ncbi:MAG TPA: phosphate acyltransferase PlsX [Edaphocola sp.]|nr:phosphate acyltransferase PlsX [Edaphocola sp.]
MMKIGLDLMGGDLGPKEAILGAQAYLSQNTDAHLVLIGTEPTCVEHLSLLADYQDRYSFVSAADVIGMHEHATKALKEKPQSSIAIGFGLLKAGKIDAFLSAGNTGAMLVGAMYSVGVIPGVLRPTIATTVPTVDGGINLLLDVGANADCKPEHLNQFAQLGATYAAYILQTDSPKVGLLNLGEEEGKGNILTQATYPLLKANKFINFVGNVEGRDFFNKKADVIVADGFTGNVVLKMAETFYDLFKDQIQGDSLISRLNYELYGGVPVLGVNAPVIIGHGISSAKAFVAMFQTAEKVIATEMIEAIKAQFATE